MPWKKLIYGRSRSTKGQIRVTEHGVICLAQDVYEQMGSPERVVLFCDPDSDRLGIRGAHDGEQGAVKVSGGTAPRRITAAWAFGQLRLKPARALYTPKPDGEMFVIGPILRKDAPPVSAVREIVRRA